LIRHVVMWTLKPEADGVSRAENARRLRERLEALPAAIPQIRALEVGLDLEAEAGAWDVVLVSTFEREADLAAYRIHPAHVALVEWLRRVRDQRATVDYRVP
jgi:hypothetical protein